MTVEKKLILTILISVLFILILFFIIIKPTFLEIQDLATRVEKEQQALEDLYQKGKTISQIKNDLKEVEGKQEMLNKIFFPKDGELNFITALEKISSQNEIKQEINLRDQQDFQNNYRLVTIHLNLEGNFKNLIKYLQSLEHLEANFNIVFFNITPISNSNNDDLVAVSLDAKTYWQK
jgi:Tfp pilus assembly protein PilO